MSSRTWCISASLSPGQRGLLLRMFPPRHEDVYCYHVMWFYAPPDDADGFPLGEIELRLDGRHIGPRHEALVGSLDGEGLAYARRRPDGKPVHVTLSCAAGVAPVEAGDIDPVAIESIKPVTLKVCLRRHRASKDRPERLTPAAA